MITQLTVKGFKTLKDFSVPLTRVSVLVGPNNCGKSNVLRALTFLGLAVRVGIEDAITHFGGAAEVFTRAAQQYLELSVDAEIAGAPLRYEIRASDRGRGSEHLVVNGEVAIASSPAPINIGKQAHGSRLREYVRQRPSTDPARQFCELLEGISLADLSMDRLRARSLPVPGVPLRANGENLAAVLDRLHGESPSIRKKIEKELSDVVPSITSVVTPTVDADGNKVVGIAEGDQVFKADAISDGILLFLALSTVTQMSGGKTLVCLEEPDRGIHPRRIKEIIEQINRVAASGSQFLLTTHSPVLLNEFRDYPESVLILDRTDEHGTRAKQLSSLPDVQEQLREVSLGDLWYSGVLGGVPSK